MNTTQKYRVGVTPRDGGFALSVTNRATRIWVCKSIETDMGNISEAAMILEEMLNGGEKLPNSNNWVEI
jgi:hypothetical protein